MLLFALWLAGRLLIAIPWFTPLVSAIVDVGFLVAVAGLVWREIAVAKSWDRVADGGAGESPGLRQHPVPRAHPERDGGGSYRARGDRDGHDVADADRRASDSPPLPANFWMDPAGRNGRHPFPVTMAYRSRS